VADEKKTQLSIILRTVDKATAGLKAFNDKIAAATKPVRDFKKQLGELRENVGLDAVVDGFKGVGSAITGILGKIAIAAGVVGVAVHARMSLIDGFDELGDKAERFGVSVDFLAQMRFAAEKAGAPVEALDAGLGSLNQNLGQLRAGTGRMKAFLDKVSPALGRQLKAAKSNEAAFDLLAAAFAKIEDPAKRAALAQKTVSDAALAPLLAKGAKGVKELRDRYLELAGSQEGAVGEAGKVDDAMKDLKAATDGIKAALVEGLAPAIGVIVEQLREWLRGHREDIKTWAAMVGKKLPGAFATFVGAIKSALSFLTPFFNSATKIKIALGALVAIMVGPLLAAIVQLGIALATNPIGLILTAIAALAVAWFLVITRWEEAKAYFASFWDWLDSKIGVVKDIIAIGLAPFIYIPAKIIQYWDPIKSFFVGLWDGVTGAFRSAWEFIKGIVDSIMGAVDKVGGAIDTVKAKIGLGDKFVPDLARKAREAAGLSSQAAAAAQPGASASSAQISVDFANAPRGTRVRTDPQSTANVDLSVGYQLMPGAL
jgi:hypothetical protein